MIAQKIIRFFEGDLVNPEDKVEYYGNIHADIVSVQISGDMSNGVFHFEGLVDTDSDEWVPIAGVNLSDYTITADPTGAGSWEVPIEGLQRFRVRTESVTGGTAKVFGRVYAAEG